MCSLLIACVVLSIRMFKRKNRKSRSPQGERTPLNGWAKQGMKLTFRAEVMPGREPDERTFTVARVLENGRVELAGLVGQHSMTEFEHVP